MSIIIVLIHFEMVQCIIVLFSICYIGYRQLYAVHQCLPLKYCVKTFGKVSLYHLTLLLYFFRIEEVAQSVCPGSTATDVFNLKMDDVSTDVSSGDDDGPISSDTVMIFENRNVSAAKYKLVKGSFLVPAKHFNLITPCPQTSGDSASFTAEE